MIGLRHKYFWWNNDLYFENSLKYTRGVFLEHVMLIYNLRTTYDDSFDEIT